MLFAGCSPPTNRTDRSDTFSRVLKSVFSFDHVSFERRLAETIAWCAPKANGSDPKQCLRSMSMLPSVLARDRSMTVGTVAEYRANYARDVPRIARALDLAGGRLLVHFPDADLSDGAAEVESSGFFDLHNVPPWDTWIALADDGLAAADSSLRQYLVAWVPPALIECARRGVAVNPERCIAWLEDANVAARAEINRLLHN